MPSIQEVKDYLGIDYEDQMTNRLLTNKIAVADAFLTGSLGADYPAEDARVKEIALMVIADLYDNRELTDKVSGNIRRLVNDFSQQIRMEMRRAADAIQ